MDAEKFFRAESENWQTSTNQIQNLYFNFKSFHQQSVSPQCQKHQNQQLFGTVYQGSSTFYESHQKTKSTRSLQVFVFSEYVSYRNTCETERH